ncbi:MAG: hypothetical protein ACFB21_09960 [Opitutales bacterium]
MPSLFRSLALCLLFMTGSDGARAQGANNEDLDIARLLANLDDDTPFVPGWWFIDTLSEGTTVEPAAGFERRATVPSGPRELSVGPAGGVALVGTQRLALYAAPRSQLSLGAFEQRPLTQPLAHDRKAEPSRSRTMLQLREGQFALVWASPLPSSELTLQLPGATLTGRPEELVVVLEKQQQLVHVGRGNARVEMDATGASFLLSAGWEIDLREAADSSPSEAAHRTLPETERASKALMPLVNRAQLRTWFFLQDDDSWRGRVMYGLRAVKR